MDWNFKLEKALSTLAYQSWAYSILHRETGKLFFGLDLFMGLTSGFITTLTASLFTLP